MTGRDYNLAGLSGGKAAVIYGAAGNSARTVTLAHIEVIAFQQPILVAIFAVQGDPFHRSFAENDSLGGVTRKRQAGDDLVFQVRADGSLGFVKIAAGVIYFELSGANFDAVNLHRCTGRLAGDAKLFRSRRIRGQ